MFGLVSLAHGLALGWEPQHVGYKAADLPKEKTRVYTGLVSKIASEVQVTVPDFYVFSKFSDPEHVIPPPADLCAVDKTCDVMLHAQNAALPFIELCVQSSMPVAGDNELGAPWECGARGCWIVKANKRGASVTRAVAAAGKALRCSVAFASMGAPYDPKFVDWMKSVCESVVLTPARR